MATQGPLSGQTIGDKYQLSELLGEGGFGVVYKALNLRLKRPQAIKVIVEQHLRDPQFRQRFDREARTLGSLNHPNILHVDDYELEGNHAYLVMPYISGGTLQTILEQQSSLSLEQAGNYLRQISAALDYAHSHNVVHLDLKPLNLLHQNGTIFLSDFGLAHLMTEGAVAGGTSLHFGTPHYMAPEHLKGKPQRASDIYALGVILFQMLTGRRPFDGRNAEAILLQHLQQPPPALQMFRPGLPSQLDTVIERAMAKNPLNRYPTAGALFNDFRAKVGLSLPALTPPDSTHNGASPSDRSHALSPANASPLSSGAGFIPGVSLASSIMQPYCQVHMDTPPSLEVMNHILQEVGKQVQQRNKGK